MLGWAWADRSRPHRPSSAVPIGPTLSTWRGPTSGPPTSPVRRATGGRSRPAAARSRAPRTRRIPPRRSPLRGVEHDPPHSHLPGRQARRTGHAHRRGRAAAPNPPRVTTALLPVPGATGPGVRRLPAVGSAGRGTGKPAPAGTTVDGLLPAVGGDGRGWTPMASERITWEDCPCCGRAAAVGWLDGVAMMFDCPGECRPTEQEVARLRRLPGSSSPVARWATARRWP